MQENILEIFNVSKFFKENGNRYLKAVNDVSLKIPKGKTLGIVGESGSGKSTLGKLCMGMLQPDRGKILYDGKDILSEDKKKQFYKKAQMIFQDPYASLDPQQRVLDIIAEGIRIHHLAINEEDLVRKVEQLLTDVGLRSDYAYRYPHEFSGGQRQRIGIARALSVEPEFLLCDEPVSSLDVTTQKQILLLLKNLQTKNNITMMFISHDLAIVKSISDIIGVMYMGELVEIAPSEELYKNPKHDYTISLLSAVPIADPIKAREKELVVYSKDMNEQVFVDDRSMIQRWFQSLEVPINQAQMTKVGENHYIKIENI